MPIITSTIYWFVVHGILNFYFIPKKKFDFIKRPFVTAAYFLIGLLVFLSIHLNYFQNNNLLNLAYSSLGIALVVLVLYLFDNKTGFWEIILSKGSDVTLQQFIIFVIFQELTKLNFGHIPNLTLAFFALHIPLFFLKSVSNLAKVILFFGISVGGIIFSYIYLNFSSSSIAINQLIHITFYIIYWMLFRKQKNMGIVTFSNSK